MKTMKLLEHILSLNSVEDIESSLIEHKERLDQVRELKEDLYIDFLNKICSKVQKMSETFEFNGQIIPLAKYGYWILPDGKEIEIDNKQAHKAYSMQHGMDVYQAIDSGWVRLITDTEFVADYNPKTFNQKQFKAVVELLKDNDSFRGYTVFTLGDDAGGHMFYEMRQFISAMRKDVKLTDASQVVHEDAAPGGTFWFNAKTHQILSTGKATHLRYILNNLEMFGLNKKSKHFISAVTKNDWVRLGVYKNNAYVLSDSIINARKALKAFLGEHQEIETVNVEVGDTHRFLDIEQIQKFVSGKIGMSEDVIHFPGSHQKSLYKDLTSAEKLNQTVSWVKNTIDKRKIKRLEDILPQLKDLSTERDLDIVDVNNAFAKRYGPSIDGYLKHKEILTNSSINESINDCTALRTRNDLVKLAKKFTDSSNVIPLNNFDTSEGKDDITLKISIFQNSIKKLAEIKSKILDTLLSQGWKKKGKNYSKNDVKIISHDIKKAFKSGAYQNRELPHFGLEVVGPKKIITESIEE